MSNFSTIIKEITKEKKDVLLSVLFGFIAGMAAISLFSASGYLLSKAAVGVPLAALVIIIALVKLLGVTRAFSRYVERYLSHRASFTILSHIRKTFYRKLDRSFSSLMRKHQSGDLLSKMVGDIESLQTFFLRVLYPPVLLTLMFFATIFFTAFFSIQIAIVLLVGFVLQMVILPAYFYWLFQRTKVTSRNKRSQLSTDATEYLFGYKDLKIFQKESDQRIALLQRNDDYEQAALLQDQKEQLHQTIYTGLGYLFTWLVITVGAYLVSSGELNGIYLAMFLLLSLTLFENSEIMGAFPVHLSNSHEVSERLGELDTVEEERGEFELNSLETLTLADVTFVYPSALSPSLNQLNLEIHKGSKTAIIGPSGSGKSTIMDMILGIERPTSGKIYWNDQLIDQINPSSIWDQANVVLQENHFFHGTIRDNLFVDETISDHEIMQVLRRVNLHDFSPDTLVAEKGSNLSGGEKQRLAFARTLFRDADLWLLDEPTSALDQMNKNQLYQELWKETKDRTVVLITHELTHLEEMDQIIVLQEGEIVERGSFEELMESKGTLYQLKRIEDSVVI